MSFRKKSVPVVVANSTTARVSLNDRTSRELASKGSAIKTTKSSTIFPSYTVHSTGTTSLDKLILLHGGQPIGTSLAIIEDGVTDFSGVVSRCYIGQGVLNGDKVIVVTSGNRLEIPGKVKLDRSCEVAETQSRASYSGSTRSTETDLKIAWRYGYSSERIPSGRSLHSETIESADDIYCSTFDITTQMISSSISESPVIIDPSVNELESIIVSLRRIMGATDKRQIVRVVLPGFLIPMSYNITRVFNSNNLLRFLSQLRALLKNNRSRMSVLLTLPSTLFDENNSIMFELMQRYFDSLIRILPIAISNGESRYQGFIDVEKLPIMSDRGAMMTRKREFAFKIGKSGMIIEPWSIPVIVEEESKQEHNKESLEF
ncbi:Elongator complex protein 4 [Dipodascopsis uninucleata]